jgi:hypothetical protein
MRHGMLPAALALALVACEAGSSPDETGSQSSAVSQGDVADTGCQVVLRHTYIDFESSLGPQTDCSSGTCWVVVTVTFDVAMAQSLAQSEAFVLYQGEAGPGWQQSAQAEPTSGAPVGFRRYQVVLRSDTFTSGPGDATVRLIPFIQTVPGQRLFDHNRVGDPLGNYALTAQNNWTIADDAAVCGGVTPAGDLVATFSTGWQQSSSGSLVAGGKLDVDYDIDRMPQTLSCTTDGVAAFATLGFVQFQPGGETLQELASGPFDSATSRYDSLPLEFDVPPGTTSASLWFETSSDCTGANQWDSDYGRNYVFTAP